MTMMAAMLTMFVLWLLLLLLLMPRRVSIGLTASGGYRIRIHDAAVFSRLYDL